MKIKFIRKGFANNSSSSHSIIFTNKNFDKISDNDEGYFGWNNFTCSSRYSKEKYLLIMLIDNMSQYSKSQTQFYSKRSIKSKHDWTCNPIVYKVGTRMILDFNEYKSEEYVYIIKNDLVEFGYDKVFRHFDEILSELASNYDGIDHQSVIRLPNNAKTGFVDHNFAKALCKTVIEQDFVILGGNDNDCDDHEYSSYNEGHELITFLKSIKYTSPVIVYDSLNDDYIIQDKDEGHLYRISFTSEETVKSAFPTLVDISITSFCDKGCSFCYQESTSKGKHADLDVIKTILDELKKEGCLEVVFGGGEPTSHPKFLDIISYAKGLGLTVGVTTKNYNLDKNKKIEEIMKNINTMAFSCNSLEETKNVTETINNIQEIVYNKTKFYYQAILGLNDLDSLMSQVKHVIEDGSYNANNFNFLGFKDFGFGKNTKQNPVDGWIERFTSLDDYQSISLGVDSVVVKKYKQELLSANVNPRFLVGEEGKFSCYIDAVKNKIAASSFTETMFDFDSNWLQTYKTF